MNGLFVLFFFALGISSSLIQIVLLREFLASFYGHELFAAAVLGFWLFWTGIASLAAGRFLKTHGKAAFFLQMTYLGTAALFFLTVIAVRASRLWLGVLPGELPAPATAFFFTAFVLMPSAGLLGAVFPILHFARREAEPSGAEHPAIGKAYLWETLGFAAGGSLFAFGFSRLDPFVSVSFAAGLNLLCALLAFRFTPPSGSRAWAGAGLVLVAAGALLFMWTGEPRRSEGLRYPGEKLLAACSTFYGSLAVTGRGEQRHFYSSGSLLGSDEEPGAREIQAHFAMLAHPSPQEVLIAGTAFNGLLAEVLKHDPKRIVYLETDPALIPFVKDFLAPRDSEALTDPRVEILARDPRAFLRATARRFDVILLHFPDPSNALFNRFFTREFYESLKKVLRPGGVLQTSIAFSPDYVTENLEDIAASMTLTFRSVFPEGLSLPENELLLLGSVRGPFADVKQLEERYRARQLGNRFVTEPYLAYRITNDRAALFAERLGASRKGNLNTDLRPRTYFYFFLRWMDLFQPSVSGNWRFVTEIPFPLVLILPLPVVFGIAFRHGREKERAKLGPKLMGLAGWNLMAAEVLMIILFQSFYGNLYARIAWIMTAFMAGMAGGTWAGNRFLPRASVGMAAKIHAAFALCFAVVILALLRCRGLFEGGAEGEIFFFSFSALFGALTGFEFPVCQKLGDTGTERLLSPGAIYGADILGATAAAAAVTVFFIPLYGVPQTLGWTAAINFSVALGLFLGKNFRCKNA
ncbi:MAG: hypothetical protein ACOY3K_02935 [Candidatus Omnitrophota bacterium]